MGVGIIDMCGCVHAITEAFKHIAVLRVLLEWFVCVCLCVCVCVCVRV